MNNSKITDFYVENTLGLKDSKKRYLKEGSENKSIWKVYKYSVGQITNDSIRFVDAEYQKAIEKDVPLFIFSFEYI